MGDRRHPFRQRLQHRRRAAHRVRLQRFAARQHQHHQRAGKIFAENHGRDDGDTGEQIGAELALQQFEEKFVDQRRAAKREGNEERIIPRRLAEPEPKAQHKMNNNRRQREKRDQHFFAAGTTGLGLRHRSFSYGESMCLIFTARGKPRQPRRFSL